MIFQIGIDYNSKDIIFIEPNLLSELSIPQSTYRTLVFGSLKKTVLIKKSESPSLPTTQIILSDNLFEELHIPIDLTYEIQLKEQKLEIGPVIGILISGKKENITEKQLRGYRSYCISYPNLNGLILLFTYDSIDWTQKIVNGFAFDPISETWKEGVYPFPSAFFSRKDIDYTMNTKLTQLVDKRFFNSYTFSKLELWEWLSQNPSTRTLLPETVTYDLASDLTEMLQKHSKLFIKPIWGMRGLGIYQIEKRNSEFILQYSLNEENESEVFDNEQKISELLYSLTRKRKYIIQQYIPLIQIDGRKLDIRVIMQKDGYGNWEQQGMITRYGPKESIVSNISRGGYAELTWLTLKNLYEGDQAKTYQKWKEIEKTSKLICQNLEQAGFLFGNLGLDIGIDKNGGLWIIEINNRYPDPTIAFDADEPQLYYQIRSNPLKYAKKLAGWEVIYEL